jgi:phosphoribosylanthranilate isomerase
MHAARVKVKICGLTNLDDARGAATAGADFLGFICHPPSPRYVEPAAIQRIIRALRDDSIRIVTVGVFVNVAPAEVEQVRQAAGLDLAQLHGDEPPADVLTLSGHAFKALRPRTLDEAEAAAAEFAPVMSDGCVQNKLGPPRSGVGAGSLSANSALKTGFEPAPTIGSECAQLILNAPMSNDPGIPQLLVDAYQPGVYGGAGRIGDWEIARTLAQRYPRLLLAGGLTPDNVAQAVQQVQPWGVDVSSGVEASPGRKDHDKLRAFLAAARPTTNGR